jgi:hypothetical protein
MQLSWVMRRHIRKAISLAAIAALLAPIGLTAVNANDVKNAESNPIKDCLSKMTNPRLAVQFLIDESKSLQDSDPSDQRVDAINSTIAALTFNFADVDEKEDEKKLEIDVRLSGFAKKFNAHKPEKSNTNSREWIALSEADNATLYDEVEKFRSRDTEGYTNYEAGLEGAERSFVEYDRERGGEVSCKTLIWLTDGNLDLDNSSSNQKLEDGQKKTLCKAGGVVDRLRSQQVFVIGLGLNSNASKKQDFSLMAQMLTGGCGERDPYGRFTEVGSSDQLVREMFQNLLSGKVSNPVPCRGEEQNNDCREVRFSVRPPLSRINVLVGLTKGINTAVVINPENETVPFAQGGKAITVQERRIQSLPSFDLSTILKIDVYEMPGEWRLQFRGPGAANALVMSIFFSDVVVEIENLPLRIDRREPQPIEVSLGDLGLEGFDDIDASGTIADFDSPVKVVAELVLGSSQVTAEVDEVAGQPGDFVVKFNPQQLEDAPSNGVLTLTPVAVLGGQEINFTPRSEEVVLVLGDGFPTISKVSATDIDNDGKSQVTVKFNGPEEGTGSARILPEQFVATEVPAGNEVSKVDVVASKDGTISVKAGQSEVIEFKVDPEFAANGRFKGEIQIELMNSFGDSQTQKVAFGFNMTKPFDKEKFLWAFLVMLISFLLVQGIILFFAVDRLSRIAKIPSETHAARFKARITESGSIEVVYPATWFDVFKSSTDPVMSSVSGKRRHDFGSFRIYGTRSAGLRWLFAGQDSTLKVDWPGNVVVGSRSSLDSPDRDGRISPHLAGEWALAVGNLDAESLERNLSEPDESRATYIDHLTGDVRELPKVLEIEAEFLYFVRDFAGERASEQIEEMVMQLSTEPLRELIASAARLAVTSPKAVVEAPSDSEDSDSRSSTSRGGMTIEDEYG